MLSVGNIRTVPSLVSFHSDNSNFEIKQKLMIQIIEGLESLGIMSVEKNDLQNFSKRKLLLLKQIVQKLKSGEDVSTHFAELKKQLPVIVKSVIVNLLDILGRQNEKQRIKEKSQIHEPSPLDISKLIEDLISLHIIVEQNIFHLIPPRKIVTLQQIVRRIKAKGNPTTLIGAFTAGLRTNNEALDLFCEQLETTKSFKIDPNELNMALVVKSLGRPTDRRRNSLGLKKWNSPNK